MSLSFRQISCAVAALATAASPLAAAVASAQDYPPPPQQGYRDPPPPPPQDYRDAPPPGDYDAPPPGYDGSRAPRRRPVIRLTPLMTPTVRRISATRPMPRTGRTVIASNRAATPRRAR